MEVLDRVIDFRRAKASDITPHRLNAREHPEAQRLALRAVMEQIGFAGAVLAVERDGKLLCCDGHLRISELGEQDVPVLVLDLDDVEVETLLLSFDSVGSMAKVNKEKLEALLQTYDAAKTSGQYASLSSDLSKSLDGMLAKLAKGAGSDWGKPRAAVEDEVPEPPAVPVTQPGDLWLLGAYFECEACGKKYKYEEGLQMTECPCG